MMRHRGFVNVKEAAQILGVALNTVRSWGAAGEIPEYWHPVNNYRMYKRKELEGVVKSLLRHAGKHSKDVESKGGRP